MILKGGIVMPANKFGVDDFQDEKKVLIIKKSN